MIILLFVVGGVGLYILYSMNISTTKRVVPFDELHNNESIETMSIEIETPILGLELDTTTNEKTDITLTAKFPSDNAIIEIQPTTDSQSISTTGLSSTAVVTSTSSEAATEKDTEIDWKSSTVHNVTINTTQSSDYSFYNDTDTNDSTSITLTMITTMDEQNSTAVTFSTTPQQPTEKSP